MMQARTERFEMRLDQETLTEVDNWRASQTDLPSRAEAVRRLIDVGLRNFADTGKTDQINLSDGEKLILDMLADISSALVKNPEIRREHELLRSALQEGNYWAIEWEYRGVLGSEIVQRSTLTETINILDLWYFIEIAFEKFTKSEKEIIRKGTKFEDVKFPGFSGNEETKHLSVAKFLIHKLGRFENFKERNLDSHFPLLYAYRRMLPLFAPMRASIAGRHLTPDEVMILLQTGFPRGAAEN